MTRFPTKDDYLKAVQHADSFTMKELRHAEFVRHPVWGIPAPAAGSSAVVFKAVVKGQEQALRFPIRADTSTKERYDALHEHFVGGSLARVVAMPRWVDDAIRVDGRTWPMVQMEWVNGRAMHQHVEGLVENGDTAALSALAQRWLDLMGQLQSSRFAHGDLQHGNVLVDERGELRLVDFDSSWIERFTGQPPPTETGHHNYQPENRPWGRWMDTFSGMVVYLSLLTLSKNPAPWRALNTGDNLLFRREDFRPPFQTPAWAHLSAVGDPELDRLAAQLQRCCGASWTADGALLDLLVPGPQLWWEVVSSIPAPRTSTRPAGPPVTDAPQQAVAPPTTVAPAPVPGPHPTAGLHSTAAPVPAGNSAPAMPGQWWQGIPPIGGWPAQPHPAPTRMRRTQRRLRALVVIALLLIVAFLTIMLVAAAVETAVR